MKKIKQPREVKPVALSAGKQVVKLLDRGLSLIVLLGLLLLFIVGCYALWDSKQVSKDAQATVYEVYKPDAKDALPFEELQKINEETLGWIHVYGTRIDYPIAQAKDNKKYVNTNIKGEYSLSGSIFLDARNNRDFEDFNSVLYGHHMAESAMFGDIQNFEEKMYFEEHKYGELYFQGNSHGIEFFAFMITDSYDDSIFDPATTDEKRQQEIITYVLDNAIYKRDIGVTSKDRIVLLTTCSSALTNGRHVLVGRITDTVYENTFVNETSDFSGWFFNTSIWHLFLELSLLWKIIILIIVVILLLMIMDQIQKYIEKNRKVKQENAKNTETKND